MRERESRERCCHKRKQGRGQGGGQDGNWRQGDTVWLKLNHEPIHNCVSHNYLVNNLLWQLNVGKSIFMLPTSDY